MTVGLARVTLFLSQSHSLKEKRMVLRRLKSLVQDRFKAAIAEVGHNELWQRAALGIAVVGQDRSMIESALDDIVRFVAEEAEVTNVDREIQTFNESFGLGSGLEHWQG